VSAEAGPDFQKAAAHRGVAFGDVDNDGRMDAVVAVLNGKVKYFHNISKNANHWSLLKLIGKRSNRMAVGAQNPHHRRGRREAVQPGHHRRRLCLRQRLTRTLRFGRLENDPRDRYQVAQPHPPGVAQRGGGSDSDD